MRLDNPIGMATRGPAPRRGDLFWKLFGVFLLAAAAGLMVLSQAAGIVAAYGGATALATWATTGLSGAIAAARLVGGTLIDRFSIPKVMAGAQVTALIGSAALTVWPSPQFRLPPCLPSAWATASSQGRRRRRSPATGRRPCSAAWPGAIYIAWCLAAVTLPILAARIYDLTGGYREAFLIAAACNLVAAVLALTLPRQGERAASRTGLMLQVTVSSAVADQMRASWSSIASRSARDADAINPPTARPHCRQHADWLPAS